MLIQSIGFQLSRIIDFLLEVFTDIAWGILMALLTIIDELTAIQTKQILCKIIAILVNFIRTTALDDYELNLHVSLNL